MPREGYTCPSLCGQGQGRKRLVHHADKADEGARDVRRFVGFRSAVESVDNGMKMRWKSPNEEIK